MTENKYRINPFRLLSTFLYPVICLIFVLFILFIPISKYESSQKLSYEIITITCILLFNCFVPFNILFVNHFLYAKKTELFLSNSIIEITQAGQTIIYDLKDIQKVNEYSTENLPWSSIVKWEIITSKGAYIISSLTISRLDFGRYLYNKIDYKSKVFPML